MGVCAACGAVVETGAGRCGACGAARPRGGRYGLISDGVRRRTAGEWDEAEFRRFIGQQLLDHRRWQASLQDLAVESGLWWMDPAEMRRGFAALREVEAALEELLQAEAAEGLADGLARFGAGLGELQEAMRVKEPSQAGLSGSGG